MDSHPKKKKKKVQSKSEIKPWSRRWQRSIQSILYTKQKQTKPHYPTLQYRGVYQKKRNQIQSKKETKYRANQTPDLEQTKPTMARSSLRDLRRSSSSSSHRRSLTRRRRSSLAHRRHSSLAHHRRSQIGLTVSTALALGLKVFLSLFLSDSLSISHSLTH